MFQFSVTDTRHYYLPASLAFLVRFVCGYVLNRYMDMDTFKMEYNINVKHLKNRIGYHSSNIIKITVSFWSVPSGVEWAALGGDFVL